MDEPRHLVVDGYNILHAWRWLRARTAGPAFDAARARLVQALRPVRDVDGVEVTVVFDGTGAAVARDEAASEPGLNVVFSPAGRTADGVIEEMIAGSRHPARCTVATADALERETVTAAWAACLSPEDLRAWCERSLERAAQAASRRNVRSNSSWENRLPL